MATEVNTVKISIKTFGNDELKKLNATFGRINKTLVLNKKSLNDTVASILRVDKRAKSFNGEYAKSNKIIKETRWCNTRRDTTTHRKRSN